MTDKTSDDLRQIRIPTAAGGEVDLEKISTLLFTSGPSDIVRVNQEKQIELMFRFLEEVNNSTDLLKNARLEVDNIIDSFEIPDGIAVEVIHDETDYSEFQFLIGAAFLLIYMILAAVFESFSLPFVMMFTIPLAAIGSILAIILTGNSLLNANTLIGLLILLGVVVNNGIILIDYTRILRQRGYRMERALIAAGQARVRPILITAITTIVALFPLAMGQGEYVATIGAPFAITVIGGLAFSAFFTLIFIPTTYAGLENALLWWQKQSLLSKIIQLTLFMTGVAIIYLNLDSLLWKSINITLLIIAIPALSYFFQTSLRTATAAIIPDGQPLHIQLKHLVKIYDSDSRFVREWKAGAQMATKSRDEQTDSRNWWLQQLAWQVPVIGFLTYFIYFYLDNHFWQIALAVCLYLLLISMIRPRGSIASIIHQKTASWALKILTFGFPALTIVIFYFQWNSLSSPLVIAGLWYLAISVRITAQNLFSHRQNIDGLTGRFAGIRRLWYLFVNSIPLIGRQKQPFAALKGVTLEIGNGMFGLLGPNGAGKTTMMRAICGILEPNRGAITINGIYLNKKREELQGLIGYLPQEFGTYENMSAVEFLRYQAMLKDIWEPEEREEIVQKVLHQVHLEEKQHMRIGTFS
ncbi:efflux RND transporter permease subunit, partial [bacterium]|nr:efflux RND transporter permease subunit [bacterium]